MVDGRVPLIKFSKYQAGPNGYLNSYTWRTICIWYKEMALSIRHERLRIQSQFWIGDYNSLWCIDNQKLLDLESINAEFQGWDLAHLTTGNILACWSALWSHIQCNISPAEPEFCGELNPCVYKGMVKKNNAAYYLKSGLHNITGGEDISVIKYCN